MDDHFPEDPETLEVGEDAAWLHFLGIAYCSRNLTDGRLPKAMVPRLTAKKAPLRLAAALVRVGWWVEDGDCFVVRSYLKHQRSRQQIVSERDGARERALKSRRTRGERAPTSRRDKPVSHTEVRQPESESDTESEVRDGSTSPKTVLINRLNDNCGQPNLKESTQVVELLANHIDLRLLDECIGWACDPNSKAAPQHPRYFLKVAADWGRQRGVEIPQLQIGGAR